MVVQRHQSAGAWLGCLPGVRDREEHEWGEGGYCFSRDRVSQAAAQFYLVAQPEGCRGQSYFRGWFSWDGQYRGFRPEQQPVAGWRQAGAGGWHELDGELFVEPDADLAGVVDGESCVPGYGQ